MVSGSKELKLEGGEGKVGLRDVVEKEGIMLVGRKFGKNKGGEFVDWFRYRDNRIDGERGKKG